MAYAANGYFDLSVSDCDRAIQLAPNFFYTYIRRGNIWMDVGDYDKAIAAFNRCVELAPDSFVARIHRALAFLDMGDFDKALADLVKAGELSHQDGWLPYYNTWLFIARESLHQDGKTALAEFRKTLKDSDWTTGLVRMYLGEITPDDLLKADAGKDSRPDREHYCEAYYYIARFHLLKGDTALARKFFQSCLDTRTPHFWEYDSALANLKRLAPPPK